jgi:hypothetical protein
MDNLVFYDNDDHSTQIDDLDYGAVAPASSDDTSLFVFNDSDTYQANDVVVTLDGDDADQLWLSLDGEVFGTTVEVGDIPPNAGSAAFVLRRVTASTTSTGPCTAELIATPGSWSSPIDITLSTNIGLDVADPPEIDTDDGSDDFNPPIPPT